MKILVEFIFVVCVLYNLFILDIDFIEKLDEFEVCYDLFVMIVFFIKFLLLFSKVVIILKGCYKLL